MKRFVSIIIVGNSTTIKKKNCKNKGASDESRGKIVSISTSPSSEKNSVFTNEFNVLSDVRRSTTLRTVSYEYYLQYREVYKSYLQSVLRQWGLHIQGYTVATRRTNLAYLRQHFAEQFRIHDNIAATITASQLAVFDRRFRRILRTTVNQLDRRAYYMPTTGLCLGWYPNPCSNNPYASMLIAYSLFLSGSNDNTTHLMRRT